MSAEHLTAIVTRPQGQAQALLHALAQKDVVAQHYPLLSIAGMPYAMPTMPVDMCVFTSPNAVRCSLKSLEGIKLAGMPCFAIGPATRDSLLALGDINAMVSDGRYDSESLLAMPSMHAVANKTVLMITGEGGRGLIEKQLRARGANVVVLACYQRRYCELGHSQMNFLLAEPCSIILSSIEAMQGLATQLESHLQRPLSVAEQRFSLVVSGQRMVQKAIEIGFKNCCCAENATSTALVEAVLRAKQQFH